MLNFFYDSLDTLKKVKKPSNKEVTNLTLIIFVVVVIAAILFAFLDGVFNELYNVIYSTLKSTFASSGWALEINQAIDPIVVPSGEWAAEAVQWAVDAALDIEPTIEAQVVDADWQAVEIDVVEWAAPEAE